MGVIVAEIASCCWGAVTWFFIISVNSVLPLIKPLRSLVSNTKAYHPVQIPVSPSIESELP